MESGTDLIEVTLISPETNLQHMLRSGLRGLVQELEKVGEDPKSWVGFCYQGTNWSFMKRFDLPNAE